MVNTVRVRRTRRHRAAATVPALPEELIQWEILVRLPAKELLRCRAVCRSWRRLTSAADFLLAHHQRQPSLPLVSFHTSVTRSTRGVVHAAVDAFDLRRTPAVRLPVLGFNDYNHRHDFTIHASCDGLLLLSLSNNRFYICNPATRQWCALPALTGGNVAALYPHRPSGEYRVLYWKDPNNNISAVYYVVTVGSSQGPRCIGLPMASPSMKPVMRRGLSNAGKHPPVLLHNCLHWHPGGAFHDKVIIFDTVVESFRWMQSPTTASSANLLEMDGTLGISHIDDASTVVNVWVLQEYEMEVWSLKHRIELPSAEMRRVTESKYFYGTIVPENLDVLVSCRFPWYLFHCDCRGKLVKKFQWDGVIPTLIGLCFKESLVRHVFFQRRDGGRVRQPRFFRGL